MSRAVACPIVFIFFYDRGWQRGVLKLMKNDHFFSIFSRFGIFSHVFGQVSEWPILQLREMMTYLKTAQNKIFVTYSCFPNSFYFVL